MSFYVSMSFYAICVSGGFGVCAGSGLDENGKVWLGATVAAGGVFSTDCTFFGLNLPN